MSEMTLKPNEKLDVRNILKDLDKMRHSLIKTALKTYTATPTEADYEFLAQETNKSVDWVREQVAAIVPTL